MNGSCVNAHAFFFFFFLGLDAQTLKATIGVLLGTPSSSCKKMELFLLFFYKKKRFTLPPSLLCWPSSSSIPPFFYLLPHLNFVCSSSSPLTSPHPRSCFSPHPRLKKASQAAPIIIILHVATNVCSPHMSVIFFLRSGSPCSTTAPPLVLSSPGKLRVVFSLGASALSR